MSILHKLPNSTETTYVNQSDMEKWWPLMTALSECKFSCESKCLYVKEKKNHKCKTK